MTSDLQLSRLESENNFIHPYKRKYASSSENEDQDSEQEGHALLTKNKVLDSQESEQEEGNSEQPWEAEVHDMNKSPVVSCLLNKVSQCVQTRATCAKRSTTSATE